MYIFLGWREWNPRCRNFCQNAKKSFPITISSMIYYWNLIQDIYHLQKQNLPPINGSFFVFFWFREGAKCPMSKFLTSQRNQKTWIFRCVKAGRQWKMLCFEKMTKSVTKFSQSCNFSSKMAFIKDKTPKSRDVEKKKMFSLVHEGTII